MGKSFPISELVPQVPLADATKGVQAVKTLAAANSLPVTPGPAPAAPSPLSLPTSLTDATHRAADAFKAARVMKSLYQGNGNQALDAINGR
jgi:hypothetical protein